MGLDAVNASNHNPDMDTTHTFHIHTTRRVAHIDATTPEQAVAIFTGREVAPELAALGAFPAFDTDPDGWRAHYSRWLEVRKSTPSHASAHGECLDRAAHPCDCPDAETRSRLSRYFDAW